MSEMEFIAQKITERMAAMLFIIGGKDMVTLGYMGFHKSSPYLTHKGCAVFQAAMEHMPEAVLAKDQSET